jgi:hypothetical protein
MDKIVNIPDTEFIKIFIKLQKVTPLNDSIFTRGDNMFILLAITLVTAASIIFAIKKQRLQFLAIPFVFLFVYFIIEVALVPAPFFETLKFIFSLG